MFITAEAARDRIKGSHNILNRVKRDERPTDLSDLVLPLSISVEGDPPEEAKGEKDEPSSPIPSGKELARLLAGEVLLDPRRKLTLPEQAGCGVVAALTTARNAAEIAGVSNSHADHLSDGISSGNTKKLNVQLADEIFLRYGIVVDRCFERLLASVEAIPNDPRELAKQGPLKASQIARNIAGIIEKATPKEKDEGGQHAHFHIYRPEVLGEEAYETIDLNLPPGSGV